MAFSRKVERYGCDVSLARAVTASAAFPFFSALKLPRAEIRRLPPVRDAGLQPSDFYRDLPRTISLSDGGVRDNSGLTAILAGHEPAGYDRDYYLIGSDAGAIVNVLQDPRGGIARLWPPSWFRGIPRGRVRKVHYLRRQFDIMGHHNNRVTVALALHVHRTRATSSKGMAMLRIDEPIGERHEPVEDVSALVRVPTRLKFPGWNAANLLTDHGANLLWARLSEYTDLADHQPLPGITRREHKDPRFAR